MKIKKHKVRRELFFFVFLSTLLIPNLIISQTTELLETEKTKYSIGAGIGLNDFHIRDEYIFPYVFRGIMFSSELSFQAKLEETVHAVDLYFSTGHPNPDQPQYDVTQYIGCISYSFIRSIHSCNILESPFELSLGSGLSSFVMNTDFNTKSLEGYGKNNDQSWYWSHALNFLICGDYSLSENQKFSLQLGVPIYRIVSRPANGHWFDNKNLEVMNESFLNAATGGKREFPWDNFVVFCKIIIEQKLNNNFNLHGSYGFNFTSSGTPLPMKSYMNNFLIGLDFVF